MADLWYYLCADCSLCEDGYTSGVGFSCIKCTPSNKKLSIALVATLAVILVVACVAIVLHLLSGEMTGTGRGCIDRMARRIPLQSVKVIIVAWQILTQVSYVYPPFKFVEATRAHVCCAFRHFPRRLCSILPHYHP